MPQVIALNVWMGYINSFWEYFQLFSVSLLHLFESLSLSRSLCFIIRPMWLLLLLLLLLLLCVVAFPLVMRSLLFVCCSNNIVWNLNSTFVLHLPLNWRHSLAFPCLFRTYTHTNKHIRFKFRSQHSKVCI